MNTCKEEKETPQKNLQKRVSVLTFPKEVLEVPACLVLWVLQDWGAGRAVHLLWGERRERIKRLFYVTDLELNGYGK